MKNQQFSAKMSMIFAAIFFFFSTLSFSQQSYQLHISNVEIPKQQEKNWLGKPIENDYVVYWELYQSDLANQPILVDAARISKYRIFLSYGDSTFKNSTVVKNVEACGVNNVKFSGNRVGKTRYYFRVEGMENDQVIVQSDTAWAICGITAQASTGGSEQNTKYNCPIALFFPVAEFLRLFGIHNETYDKSTFMGKAAFTGIWAFVFAGIIIYFRKCYPSFKNNAIFPLTNGHGSNLFKSKFDKELEYELLLAPRFRFVIEAWKLVIDRINLSVHDKKLTDLAAVEKKCYENFKNSGFYALSVLKEILSFDPKDTEKEAKFGDLEKEILKYFGQKSLYHDMTTEPIKIKVKSFTTEITWDQVKSDIKNPVSMRNLADYPIVKVLAAGLENHIINGFNWQQTSGEVDRAIENRAHSEIQILQEHSALDWLWNLGALAPLLGLFGTVTGISSVFSDIKGMEQGVRDQLELVKILSSGIFEALWTTIYGLAVGIILMLAYYIYKNKLDWIYNKWTSLFVHVTERL